MPNFLFKRVDLDWIYPPFLSRVLDTIAELAEGGHHYWAQYGFRSMDQQKELRRLFLLGQGGRAAPPGLSAHNYGLAFDFVLDGHVDRPGLQPEWDVKKYRPLTEVAKKHGLETGASYKDHGHVVLRGFDGAGALEPLKRIWHQAPQSADERKKLNLVWAYVDTLQQQVK